MGSVFNIQRFSTADGPGIRTVVFLKGCPLSCEWCHNPESNFVQPDIFFDEEKCIGCRMCEKLCDRKLHIFDGDKHIYLRDSCIKCMKCASGCPAKALESCGKELTAGDVVNEILRDRDFYKESDGGVTLSGGEPLMQYDFSLEILKQIKEYGIHTAVETSGYCCKSLNEIKKYVDLWLYDVKIFQEAEHIKYTGGSNKKIFENLFYLDNSGAKIILRCPVIPHINFNEKHFNEISVLANKLKNIVAIHIEPYHPLGIDKSSRLGRIQKYGNREFLNAGSLSAFAEDLKSKTNVNVEIL